MRAVMEDLNGDGIPDGAQITAKWIKGNAEGGTRNVERGTRPIMSDLAAGVNDQRALDAGLVTVGRSRPQYTGAVENVDRILERPRPQFQETSAATNLEMQAQAGEFDARRDRAADLYGIRRTNTGARPLMVQDEMSALDTQRRDTSLSVARRQGAQRRFEDITTMLDRAAGRASSERIAASEADAVATKAAEAADARRYAADVGGSSRVQAAEVGAGADRYQADQRLEGERAKAAAMEKRDAARNQMLMDAKKFREESKNATTLDKRNADIKKYLDEEYSPNGVSKMRLRGYLVETRDKYGNLLQNAQIDPVWESMLESLQKRADEWGIPLFEPKPGEVRTAPPAEPAPAGGGAGRQGTGAGAAPGTGPGNSKTPQPKMVFDSEQAARASGKKAGDVVYLRGVGDVQLN